MFNLETDQNPASVFAVVNGEILSCLPSDLYIPPDALKVFLETFEGPLDLLLYLIKKQRLDILNIPIAQITLQYMKYVDLIREYRFELAAEYLVMAAVLAEIKSRMLLPSPVVVVDDDMEDLSISGLGSAGGIGTSSASRARFLAQQRELNLKKQQQKMAQSGENFNFGLFFLSS